MEITDDLFETDEQASKIDADYKCLKEFEGLDIGDKNLLVELERRGIELIEPEWNSAESYRIVLAQSVMNQLRSFANLKERSKPHLGADILDSALKGAMGETAVAILLRGFLDVFGHDTSLVKVNLKIHPKNDGGKDCVIAGIKYNVKYTNSSGSGMFFSQRDLNHIDDSHYYVLVNGEGLTTAHLLDEKFGSYPVTVSGAIPSSKIIKDNMTQTVNRSGKSRWVFEKANMSSVNNMILHIIDALGGVKSNG